MACGKAQMVQLRSKQLFATQIFDAVIHRLNAETPRNERAADIDERLRAVQQMNPELRQA